MKTRHKIPAVFSIYMVDVLCCALGCVILLWQLYHHESEEQTAKNDEIRAEKEDALKKWARANAEIEDLLKKLAQADFLMATRDRTIASLQGNLEASLKKQLQSALSLEEAQKNLDKADKLALVRKQEYDDMKKTLAAAEALLAVLRLDLKTQKEKSTLTAAELADKICAHADLLDRLAAAEKKTGALSKDLALLQDDKISLLKKAAAAENRFAGITLTGKKVVFLVDMSGSMDRVDEATFDPDKWPIVCETVASVMRSLPDLREYQVIVFSDQFKYAFGMEGNWLEYKTETSPRQVADGLKAIKPKGGTDMHAAFQEAFRYRDLGMDTVYLFSDGLPNLGEGLSASAANLPINQRGEILAKHIRGRLKSTWNRPDAGQTRVRINCVGFFFESPDLGAFLWALARENEGSFVGMSKP